MLNLNLGEEGAQLRNDLKPQNVNQNTNVQPEEYVPEFPCSNMGQNENMEQRLPLDDNDRIAEIFRRALRDGPPDFSLEGVSTNSFTLNIRYARNLFDFKLSMLEMYDGKTDPTVHPMRYIRHIKVSSAFEGVMRSCFPLYLTDLTTMWFRRLDNASISTWTELLNKFMRKFRLHI